MRVTTNCVGQLLARVSTCGDRMLLIDPTGSYSGSAFFERVGELKKQLAAERLAEAETVAIAADTAKEAYAAIFATWLAGGTAALLPSDHRESALKLLQASVIIRDGLVCRLSRTPIATNSGDLVLFTSGSSGQPKGVCLSLEGLSLNAALAVKAFDLRERDRILINSSPLFTSSFCHFLATIAAGSSFVSNPGMRFAPQLAADLSRYECTGFGGAPAHLTRMVTQEGVRLPTSVRFWISSGDSLPNAIADKARECFPQTHLYLAYGLTEASGRVCILGPIEANLKKGSVGKPLPGFRVSIRSPNGVALTPEQVGEIFILGPSLFSHYWGESPSQSNHTPFGFRTGDWGYLDRDGFLWVEGRSDAVFKSGGEKVSARRIRDALFALGLFQEVAVTSEKESNLGHVPVAHLSPHDGVRWDPVAWGAMVRTTLPGSHVPKRWVRHDSLPVSSSGKISLAA